MFNIIRIIMVIWGGLFVFNSSYAGDFLPPDEAFSFNHNIEKKRIRLQWAIAPGYYLYQQRLSVYDQGADKKTALPITFISTSALKHDRNFGEVPIFFDQLIAAVNVDDISSNSLLIEYQGCSKKGLCYQPQVKTVTLPNLDTEPKDFDIQALHESTSSIATFLSDASFTMVVLVFLLLGVGLSFTPCILPMIPILSGIIVGQGAPLTARKGALLSAFYVLGMSISYALAGVLAATLGAKGNVQMYLQNPWVIGSFAAVFVLLSLSMFGFYSLALPAFIQNRLHGISNKQKGGSLTGVFVMGALAALIVSPCVSAPLAGALVFISSTGDKWVGGSALFALGIGMGLPLIAIGAGGGRLVPKAGMWMNHVKVFFGVVLLLVAIWLLSRILSAGISQLLTATLIIVYALYLGALESIRNVHFALKSASFLLLLYGAALFFPIVNGNLQQSLFSQEQALIPRSEKLSHGQQGGLLFSQVGNQAELQKKLAQASAKQQPVLLDFYADWCTACIDMQNNVFNKASVVQALAGYRLLQIDVTDNNQENQRLLDAFSVFGPPSVIFFDSQGQEQKALRIQGEVTAEAFLGYLKRIQ